MIRTWTCALIIAGISPVIPVAASANPQIPSQYKVATTAKYDASTVRQSYVGLAGGLYNNTLRTALALANAIEFLNKAPSAETLAAARAACANARSSYLATEAFRFYGGPIDAPKTEARAAGPQSAIDSNFLLLERSLAGKAPGNASQRKALANAATAIHNDVALVLKQWDPTRRTSYATEFLQLEGSEAVGRILRGLGMQAITLAGAPSDTRTSEAAAVLSGMHSIWHAQLNKITAPSIEALVSKVDPNAATAVSSALATAQTQASAKDPALPATLQTLALAITNAGRKLGVAISID